MAKQKLTPAKEQREAEASTLQQTKTIRNPFSVYDYDKVILFLEQQGKKDCGAHFSIPESDQPIVKNLAAYFLKDKATCDRENINLDKGVLLSGPIGCGKTSIMRLMRYFCDSTQALYILKTCRDISFEFINGGYDVVHRYSRDSFFKNGNNETPRHYCFDDLGVESNLKYYGNECNVMAEILLGRYELFCSRRLLTHLTSNLSASEIDNYYGNRVRSRLREMCNLFSYGGESKDKRK